jgi:[acyl-carrier-protein] S-malonyltransferase
MNNNLALVFPGQGSQKIGMLGDLAAQNSIVERTFAEASDVLGYDAWAMVQTGEQEAINLTERTQPILLTSSVAIWRLWQNKGGPMPAQMAGHSLGEWSALVCSEVLAFADAINIVRARGAYMQDAVPVGVGAMAAILGVAYEVILDACDKVR